jgi:hypothetical protein
VLLNGDVETVYSMAVGYTRATGEYEILGIRKGLAEGGMSLKYLRSLWPGDVITPVHWGYRDVSRTIGGVRQATESGLPRSMFTMGGSDVKVTKRTKFAMERLADGIYVLKFKLTDIRGNSVDSAGAQVEIIGGEMYVKLHADAL